MRRRTLTMVPWWVHVPVVLTLLLRPSLVAAKKKHIHISEDTPIDVYYINLDRRPDRRANIHREFEAAGMVPPLFHVHRFKAIDGLSHEFTEEETSWFTVFDEEVGKTSPHNTNLLKCNSLSHMGVWKRVAESGKPYALVFQDDVQLASQQGSDVFLRDLENIFQQNPRNSLITWIGANGYASGSVSRSAPMDPKHYNADTASTVLPGTNGIIGRCRKGLIATNSLAYILTQEGAQELLRHFTTKGWAHHTDHDLVDYLDSKEASYISRKILATTMDDGIFGSDIFSSSQEDALALQNCQRLVQQGVTVSSHKYSSRQATQQTAMLRLLTPAADWAQTVGIHCEPMACHFQDCPAPVVTYVYLSWPTSTTQECEAQADGSTTCADNDDNDKFELDASGVRRDKTRHKLMLGEAPANLTFQHVVDQLPARWVLEEWAKGNDDTPMSAWPKCAQGDAVEALIEGEWVSAKVVAVGYKEPNWPVYATYVVQLEADQRLIPIVQEQQVRKRS